MIAQGDVCWADLPAPGIVALDRTLLVERVGRLSRRQLDLVFSGIDIVLGR